MNHSENSSTTLKVFSTLAVRAPFDNGVLDNYPQNQMLSFEWSPTTVIEQKLTAGQHADLVIATDNAVMNMVKAGLTTPEHCFPVATAYFGVAASKGHPLPDISTPDAFLNALTQARSVAYSLAGASGIYLQKILAEHGLLEQVNARATRIPQGFTAEKLVTGEADLAIQQMSELMTVDGIDIVGAFPVELQQETPFTIAIMKGCSDQQLAQNFIDYLLNDQSRDAYVNNGLKCR